MIVREILRDPDYFLADPKGFDYFNDFKDTSLFLQEVTNRGNPDAPEILERLTAGNTAFHERNFFKP